MGIGSYRHLVTLAHPAVVLDPPTWYCAVQPAATQVMEGLAAFFIRGRYHPGIGLETQIQFEGRTFQVQSVTDLDERHTEIQVMAVEVVGRGTTPGGAPVNVPPTIDVGPASVTLDAGESVTLTVEASGAVPLYYQWLKDGADLPGMDDQFYVTGPLEATTTYAVRVSNAYGSVLSSPAVVTVPPAALTYQEQVIADGAAAYWPLDDPSGTTAEDLVAGNHGTIVGGVTLNQPGVTADSQCMTFNGASGRINTASVVAIPADSTIEVWFKTTWGGHSAMVSNRALGSTSGVWCGEAGTLAAYGTSEALGVGLVTSGVWRHGVFVFNGGTLSFFLDGVLDVSRASVWRASVIPFSIGVDPQETAHFFLGSLQDIAIYPRALSPAEILAHYRMRVPAPAFPPGLVSYWSFDSGWNDQVGTNHLTNVNGVTSVAGKLGNAADFESSSSQYLSHADPTPLGVEDFTYCCWFRYETPGDYMGIVSKDGSYTIRNNPPGNIAFFTGGSGSSPATGPVVSDTNWHFVVAWHDAAAHTVNLQVDGGGPVSASADVFGASATPVKLGVDFNIYFDGLIDEVGLWRRVLTAGERSDLWNGGAGLPRVP